MTWAFINRPGFSRKRYVMTTKRRIIVDILATIAFIALFLLPVIGFLTTETTASATQQSASYSGDYVFFVVQNNDVPLAAAPTSGNNLSSYILWIGVASAVVFILFVYSAWNITTQKNIRELSRKMTPFERRSFRISSGFFHPIRCHQLAREAEDTVASMYIKDYL